MSFASTLRRPNPSVFFRRDPWYYFRYDGLWLLLCLAAIGTMTAVGYEGINAGWSWGLLGGCVLACYAQALSHVFVHNCVHVNFPRSVNRLVGEICGAIIVTRYASWEILHQRHHKYSDDVDKDPHPVNGSFLQFLHKAMLINLEKTLHDAYHERHGDTEALRKREQYRAYLSYLTMGVLLLTWYMALGPIVFLTVYAPSALVGLFFIAHLNWRAHNGISKDGDFGPVNLDHGVYWVLNRMLFGTYYHANHHEMASLFNPGKYDSVMADKAARREAKAAVKAVVS